MTLERPAVEAANGLRIVVDDLTDPGVAEFLAEHLRELASVTPHESMHALDLDGLRRPEVTFWVVLDGDDVVGCAALKALDERHAELKSMRTAARYRRGGVASSLLGHLVERGRERGFTRLSLETGSSEFFAPARALYARHGFEWCGPFAGYREDPNSVFMTRAL